MSSIDQLGNTITIPSPPQRIISLVPSQTELLADLGLDNRVLGITKFCVHPPSWKNTKRLVGGTKNFDFDAIDQLAPDFILANKEENYREGIERLQQKYPVWVSDIFTLSDALQMIAAVGNITATTTQSSHLTQAIHAAFDTVQKFSGQSVLYLIWKNPWMAAAGNTFIDTMLDTIGLKNSVGHLSRYPALTDHDISSLCPEFIFLSSEPYPFKEKQMETLRALSPSSTIVLVDGEMFSWYGSRLLHAPPYFNSLIARWQ